MPCFRTRMAPADVAVAKALALVINAAAATPSSNLEMSRCLLLNPGGAMEPAESSEHIIMFWLPAVRARD